MEPKPVSGDFAGLMRHLDRLREGVAAREAQEAGRAERERAWRESPEGRAATAKRLEAERAAARAALLARAAARSVPQHPRVMGVVLADAPPVTPALAEIDEALAWRAAEATEGLHPPPATLVLFGQPGNGKTAALSRLVARWPREALYVRARAIGSTPENDWSDNRAFRERLGGVDALAIDEAGLEESKKAGPRIAGILAERHDQSLLTVVATNIDAETFMARYLTDRPDDAALEPTSRRLISRLVSEQGRNGEAGGLPWWRELPDCDLRDPANLEALVSATPANDRARAAR